MSLGGFGPMLASWANFALLKQKRLELKRLPDSRKIDCITINIVPFKGGVEDVFKKLSEALVETLRTSIEKDKEEVEQFVRLAQEQLSSNPQSVSEIEAMHSAAMEIETNKKQFGATYIGLREKNRMIKQLMG